MSVCGWVLAIRFLDHMVILKLPAVGIPGHIEKSASQAMVDTNTHRLHTNVLYDWMCWQWMNSGTKLTYIHPSSIHHPSIHPSIHTQVSPLKGVYATVPWRQHSAPRMHRAQQEKRLIGGGFKDFVSPKFGSLGGNDAIWLTIVFWLFV